MKANILTKLIATITLAATIPLASVAQSVGGGTGFSGSGGAGTSGIGGGGSSGSGGFGSAGGGTVDQGTGLQGTGSIPEIGSASDTNRMTRSSRSQAKSSRHQSSRKHLKSSRKHRQSSRKHHQSSRKHRQSSRPQNSSGRMERTESWNQQATGSAMRGSSTMPDVNGPNMNGSVGGSNAGQSAVAPGTFNSGGSTLPRR